MQEVNIEVEGRNLLITSPPNKDFVAQLRVLGAQWDPDERVWVCDARDEERVRALCMDDFGTDGERVSDDLCDLRLRVSYIDGVDLRVGDRVLLGRAQSTGQPWTPQGVVVVNGRVPTGTGRIDVLDPPLVIEVRDLTPLAASRLREATKDLIGVEVVG